MQQCCKAGCGPVRRGQSHSSYCRTYVGPQTGKSPRRKKFSEIRKCRALLFGASAASGIVEDSVHYVVRCDTSKVYTNVHRIKNYQNKCERYEKRVNDEP
mmetsp:Transcript_3158/g.3504  ORF Transcript_3158/g.3504 Transcript_3158/m.3504 type:complete len:100 (-) Transcript_3158:36-335(-)